MALTKDDKEWVGLVVEKIVAEVSAGVIKQHIDSCPHGKSLMVSKACLVSFCVGVGLFCGAGVFNLAKLLIGF